MKHKNRKTGMLYDVLIYNFEKGFENAQIIKSDSGRLEMTADKQHLYLHLYNGCLLYTSSKPVGVLIADQRMLLEVAFKRYSR